MCQSSVSESIKEHWVSVEFLREFLQSFQSLLYCWQVRQSMTKTNFQHSYCFSRLKHKKSLISKTCWLELEAAKQMPATIKLLSTENKDHPREWVNTYSKDLLRWDKATKLKVLVNI